jgi:hypothetical protein
MIPVVAFIPVRTRFASMTWTTIAPAGRMRGVRRSTHASVGTRIGVQGCVGVGACICTRIDGWFSLDLRAQSLFGRRDQGTTIDRLLKVSVHLS